MTAIVAAAALAQVAVLLLLVAAGVWAFRRFRLPSVPWLLAYLLLGIAAGLPTTLVAKRVVDQASAAGGSPVGSVMTLGEFLASVAYVDVILGSVAKAIVAWFVLSELAFAYSQAAPDAAPAVLSLPRRHSSAVGLALLACVTVLPAFWLTLLAAQP